MANKIAPQTILYPKNGYYITKSGKNEFFGESKTLSSEDEIIYIDYQKIDIEDNHYIYYALLQLNIVRVTGTANSITLNIYVADDVNQHTGWLAVNSTGSLRGALLESKNIDLSDDNEVIHINIYDFAQQHIYGASGKSGIIIEMIPNSGTTKVKIVGLYCWDDDVGEKQNPIIQMYYGQTSTAYIESKRITKMVTEDAYIDSYNKNANYGNTNIIKVENDKNEKRALFKADLNEIPAGSYIKKAILYLPKNTSSSTEGQRGLLYRVLQDWDEDYVTWLKADNSQTWNYSGGYYDDTDEYNSYNMIVEKASNQYDVTKLLQVVFGSFGHSVSSNFYGFMFKYQNIIFDSHENNNIAYLDVVYTANQLNQPPQPPTLNTPTSGSTITTQPAFIATINDDNAYGDTEGDNLHFRIEISKDLSFSDESLTSYSTSDSTTGWHWSALGDFSDDSTTFPISAGSYTPGTSKIKFVMSETGDTLDKGFAWNWRMFTIDE